MLANTSSSSKYECKCVGGQVEVGEGAVAEKRWKSGESGGKLRRWASSNRSRSVSESRFAQLSLWHAPILLLAGKLGTKRSEFLLSFCICVRQCVSLGTKHP